MTEHEDRLAKDDTVLEDLRGFKPTPAAGTL